MSNQITPNPSVPSQVVQEVKFPQFVNNLGIIPTTYKDSMSYYECLGWLCKYLEETVIPTVNENGEAVEELQGLYIELNSYVTHYFDTLDVQEEINNKLDQMVSNGTLNDILNVFFTDINNEIAVLSARMDEFTNLTEGSTSGDAELQDIRIAENGYTYASAGSSVRNQIKNIVNNIGENYCITSKGASGSYFEIQQTVSANTEFYIQLNTYSGITPTHYIVYGYVGTNFTNLTGNLSPNNDIRFFKTSVEYDKLRVYIAYTTLESTANVYANFIFGFTNKNDLINKLAYSLNGSLSLNAKGNNTPPEINESNISSYITDSDLDNETHFKVYYFDRVESALNKPISRMNGTFISLPYVMNKEFGTSQIFIDNQTNNFYYRTNYGSPSSPTWHSWYKILTESTLLPNLHQEGTPTIVNSSNVETIFPTLDLNDIHNMTIYFLYHCNDLDNKPVEDINGIFYTVCYSTSIEPGTIQYYVHSTDNSLYYRSCYGASNNPVWNSWVKISTENVKATLNTKTYRILRKVLCVGDSFTSGHISEGGETSPSNEYYAWPHYMETNGNVYVNCGISGANSSTWLTNANGLAKAETTGHVQAYIIGLGINDASSNPDLHIDLGDSDDIGTDENTYYANISKIVRELKEISPLAKIIMLTRPQVNSTINSTYNEAIRDIVEAYENDYDTILLDLYNDYNELFTNTSLTGDFNGHYSAIGYEQIAEILSYCLSDLINKNISKFRDIHTIPMS